MPRNKASTHNPALSDRARLLRASLADLGQNLTHAQALGIVAKMDGEKNIHVALSRPGVAASTVEAEPQSASTHTRILVRDATQEFKTRPFVLNVRVFEAKDRNQPDACWQIACRTPLELMRTLLAELADVHGTRPKTIDHVDIDDLEGHCEDMPSLRNRVRFEAIDRTTGALVFWLDLSPNNVSSSGSMVTRAGYPGFWETIQDRSAIRQEIIEEVLARLIDANDDNVLRKGRVVRLHAQQWTTDCTFGFFRILKDADIGDFARQMLSEDPRMCDSFWAEEDVISKLKSNGILEEIDDATDQDIASHRYDDLSINGGNDPYVLSYRRWSDASTHG